MLNIEYQATIIPPGVYREIEEKPQQMGLMVNEKKAKYISVSVTQKRRQTQNWKVGDKVYIEKERRNPNKWD